MRRTILFLLSVLLSFSLLLTGCGSPSYAEHVISHRGAPKGETEHSFVSYDLAIGYGSINIEQDNVSSAKVRSTFPTIKPLSASPGKPGALMR